MRLSSDASFFMTRLQACDGWVKWFTMHYVVPWMGQAWIADDLAELCAGGPRFKFLSMEGMRRGTVRWHDDVGDGDDVNNGVKAGSERVKIEKEDDDALPGWSLLKRRGLWDAVIGRNWGKMEGNVKVPAGPTMMMGAALLAALFLLQSLLMLVVIHVWASGGLLGNRLKGAGLEIFI